MRVEKSGAFVRYGDRYVLMFGPHPSGNYLGVVRLGGHREGDETPWECAAREVLEEASMRVRCVPSPVTYRAVHGALEATEWEGDPSRPILLTQHGWGPGAQVTVIYLAESDDAPVPAAETQGLLLPTAAELGWLVRTPVTLAQYLAAGGQAVMRSPMDPGMRLECSYQVRLLSELTTPKR